MPLTSKYTGIRLHILRLRGVKATSNGRGLHVSRRNELDISVQHRHCRRRRHRAC